MLNFDSFTRANETTIHDSPSVQTLYVTESVHKQTRADLKKSGVVPLVYDVFRTQHVCYTDLCSKIDDFASLNSLKQSLSHQF